MIKVSACGLTDQGRVRDHNEDALLVDLEHGVFAVADGMGGHAAGEVASRLAIETLTGMLAQPREGEGGGAEKLCEAIERADRLIAARSAESPEVRGMGTTIVAAMVDGRRLSVAHVGDSRAYLVRAGEIRPLTSDHSFVNELVRLGMMSREHAARDPRRNVVTRALGSGMPVAADLWQGDVEPGDVILLCSDGLTNMVDDEHILALVHDGGAGFDKTCGTLIDAANEAGGDDNITVILLGFEEPLDPVGGA